jgi:hypothetical protein
MAKIVINDLLESVELDREALTTIYGGSPASHLKPDLIQQQLSKPKLQLLELARTKYRLKMQR